jgi:hypothetical protein
VRARLIVLGWNVRFIVRIPGGRLRAGMAPV